MATNWTDEQLSAIDNRGGTLLISAAAGSGKTAVLVERVIRRIIDENVDISKFLIVTFTEAAASEMRTKIIRAISEKLSHNPKNSALSRQLRLVYHAKITTVHAFCMGLIRSEAHNLNLRQDFRIGDTSECSALLDDALNDVLEDCFSTRKSGDDFDILAENSVSGRDDRGLYNLIMDIYQKVQSSPFPKLTLDSMLYDYQNFTDINCSKWTDIIKTATLGKLKYAKISLISSLEDMENNAPEVYEKYSPAYHDDIKTLDDLMDKLVNSSWDDFVLALQNIKHKTLGSVRGYDDKSYLDKIKASRDDYKKVLKKLSEDVFSLTEDEIASDIAHMLPFIRGCVQVTQRLIDHFATLKRAKNLLDFGDLEHFAVQLVTQIQPDGTIVKSDFAKSLNFEEIMVDEYQDTNDVQDMLFTALSNDEKNIFMVGDVKQSIYRFRLANPKIFLSKYLKYAKADMATAGEPRKITLSKNFRSRKQVLSAVNFIFKALMSEEFGGVNYTDEEFLYLGSSAKDEENSRYNTELCLIDMSNTEEVDEDSETPEKIRVEAHFTALKIANMIKSGFLVTDKSTGELRACTASDFAILLRSVTSKQMYFREALSAQGISSVVSEDDDLLSFPEISVMVAFLSVIDNPRQDIPLISIMRSPIYAFTEQELAKLRINSPETDIYDAVLIARNLGDEKCKDLLEDLEFFRKLALNLPVHTLIYQIYDVKQVLALYGATPNGAERIARLEQFFEHARNFENSAYKGIFRYVGALRRLVARGDTISVTRNTSLGGVKIMSIHKSKGLEFPIVLVCDLAKQFNMGEMKSPALIDSVLGIAPKCRNNEKQIEYSSLPRFAVAESLKKQALEEELRVLYVALTRPQDKLIMIGSYKNLQNRMKKLAMRADSDYLDPYFLQTINSYADLTCICALKHVSCGKLREYAEVNPSYFPIDDSIFEIEIVNQNDVQIAEQQGVSIQNQTFTAQKLDFYEYPRGEMCDIPSKITATELNKMFKPVHQSLDNENQPHKKTARVPLFAEEKPITAAEKGIAHHLFMQVCNFDSIKTDDDVKIQTENMKNRGLLTKKQADAIDSHKILGFFHSPLYARLKKSPKVQREFRFSILKDANEYFDVISDNEQILVQGVIDCMFLEDEKWVVIDFKTDFVTFATMHDKALEYAKQLEVYRDAVNQVYKTPVSETAIYFFSTASEIVL